MGVKVIQGERDQFIVIDMKAIRDPNLKLADLGLLVRLMSLPPNWLFSIKGMEKTMPDGRQAITSSFNHLKKLRYVETEQYRSRGRFLTEELTIYEDPTLEWPESYLPQSVRLCTDSRTQSINYHL